MRKLRKSVIKKASVIFASTMVMGGTVLPTLANPVLVHAQTTSGEAAGNPQTGSENLKANTVYSVSIEAYDKKTGGLDFIDSKARILVGSNGVAELEIQLLKNLMGTNYITDISIRDTVNKSDSKLVNLTINGASGTSRYRDIIGKAAFGPIANGESGKFYGSYTLKDGSSVDFELTINWKDLKETADTLPEYHKDVKSVATPVISPNTNVVSANTALSIDCSTPGAEIFYTVDGSDPETSDTRKMYGKDSYTIEKNVTVRAKAHLNNEWSNEAKAEYTVSEKDNASDNGIKESNIFKNVTYKEGTDYDTITLTTDSDQFNEGTKDVPEKDKKILRTTEYYMDLTQEEKEKVHCVFNGGARGGFVAPFDTAKNNGEVIITLPKGHFDKTKPVELEITQEGYRNTHVTLDLNNVDEVKMKQYTVAADKGKSKKHVSLQDLEKGKVYTGSFQAKRMDDPSRDSMLAGFFDKNVKLEIDNEGNVKASFYNTVYAFSMIDFAAQFPGGKWGAAQTKDGSRVPTLNQAGETVAATYTLPIPDPKTGGFVGAVNVKAMGGSEGMFGMYDRYTQVKMIFNDDFTEGFDGFTHQSLALSQEQIVNRALMTFPNIDTDGNGIVSDEELKNYQFPGGEINLSREAMFSKYNISDNFDLYDISWLKKIGHKELVKKINFNDMKIMKIGDELKGFNNLEELKLSCNVIEDIKDGAFSDNKNLKKLELQSNLLRKITAKTFTGLDKLDSELKLSDNRLADIEAGSFDMMQGVKTFDLSGNIFESFDAEKVFSKNPSRIDQLYLSGNKLSSLPSNLNKLTNLRILSLSNNQITSLGEEITNFQNLRDLYLGNNYLAEIPESLFTTNPKLSTVNLEKNSIYKIPKSLIDRLKEDEIGSIYEYNAIDYNALNLEGLSDSQKDIIKENADKYPSKMEYGTSLKAENGKVSFNSELSSLDYYLWSRNKVFMKERYVKEAVKKVLGKETIDSKEDLKKFREANLPNMDKDTVKNSILTSDIGTVDVITFTNEIQKLINGKWETMWMDSKTQEELAKTGEFKDPNAKDGDKYRLVMKIQSAVQPIRNNTYVVYTENKGNANTSVSKLDKNNLADGKYTINVNMVKPDRKNMSMSDNAITHTAVIEVKNGKPYIRVEFKGMTVDDKFGYLGKLSYYDEGYSYNYMGLPKGETKPATVISTQKDSRGNDIIDSHNSDKALYPHEVEIPIVDSVIADNDGYLPLHVFVPIMEDLVKGNGDQDVLMKLDWNTLKKGDDNTSVTPDNNGGFNNNTDNNGGSNNSGSNDNNEDGDKNTGKSVTIKTASGDKVLEEGNYSVPAEMFKAIDRTKHSMANDAINPNAIIEVKDGKASILLDFEGLNMDGKMGYLGKLSYYDEGYTYSHGNDGYITGTLKDATVLSTQKIAKAVSVIKDEPVVASLDGSFIADANASTTVAVSDADAAPNVVKFPYVSTARNDASGFIPLHVFVPIMESISAGSGDQDVYLKLNLDKLKKISNEEVTAFINSDPSNSKTPGGETPGSGTLHDTLGNFDGKRLISNNGGLNNGDFPSGLLNNKLGRPATGDNSGLVTWAAVAVVAGAVAGTAYFVKKKKDDEA